ncbi:hypothetical protein M9H77_32781 [Catharanthus roseus]|uniref:Uncharacterized protein n=1 Tax=Catharanthus roseus TaxID=4058 RepID=A0ACC0A4R6_CATRO|nr:hypothetical protein M9H77_32781 [Catharanthus roseus]
MEPSNSLPFQDFPPPMHLVPTFYPPFYQNQLEASRFHLGHQSPTGIFSPKIWFIDFGGSLGRMPMDQDASGRFDAWGLSTERSPLTSTITDDDILEMSYEEYLEAHSRLNKTLYQSGVRQQFKEKIPAAITPITKKIVASLKQAL